MRKHLDNYDNVALRPEDLQGPMDFAKVFGRCTPVHIEIGSGKGAFLVTQARARPDVNFLGIEWANKYYRYVVDRIGRWGLTNVRVLRADAPVFLRDFIAKESVDCFHIYFPDPWPKKKHHRRRFVQTANLDMLIDRLKPGGQIRIATDHEEYFQQIQEVTGARLDRLEPIEFERPAGAREGEITGTNYERKYIKESRSFHTLAFRKR
ncbi:MAG: tRNA (guanosine(46)-N7)-methyltransferase TrmB [Solirubrobacterales bacterium]